jgi:hypothetical protein
LSSVETAYYVRGNYGAEEKIVTYRQSFSVIVHYTEFDFCDRM